MLKILSIKIIIKNCLWEPKTGIIIAAILQVKSYGIDELRQTKPNQYKKYNNFVILVYTFDYIFLHCIYQSTQLIQEYIISRLSHRYLM
jgi:hypothetical protein